MKITAQFKYLINGKEHTESIELELANNTLTFSQLAQALQAKSVYAQQHPNTVAITSITQDATTWTRENSQATTITLQENIPIDVTLAVDLTPALFNDVLFEFFKNAEAKSFTTTMQLTAKQFAAQTQNIYRKFPSAGLFDQTLTKWQELNSEQRQALINHLSDPNHIKQLLSFINTLLQSDQGVELFYQWIKYFRDDFITFYKKLTNPSVYHDALFALISKELGNKNFDAKKIISTADAIAESYSTIAGSLRDTASLFTWADQLFARTSYKPSDWHTPGVFYRNFQAFNFKNLLDALNTWPDITEDELKTAKSKILKLDRSNLSEAMFSQTTLIDADFSRSDVSESYFIKTKFSNVNFDRANLSACVLSECIFDKHTTLINTNLVNAKLDNAKGLDQINSTSLISAKTTTLAPLKIQIDNAKNFRELLNIYMVNKNGILFVPNKPFMKTIRSWWAPIPTTSGNEFLEAIREKAEKILQSTKELITEEQECLKKLDDLIELPPYLQGDILRLTAG